MDPSAMLLRPHAGLANQEHLLLQQRKTQTLLRQRVVQAGDVDLAAHQPFVDLAAETADQFQEHAG